MTANTDNSIWDAYNLLLMGPDTERLRKIMARAELFKMTLTVPGDIVECGVFKGAGFIFWLKLLHIFAPASLKNVIGFDLFGNFSSIADAADVERVEAFIAETAYQGTAPQQIMDCIQAAGLPGSQSQLVVGDITQTARAYVEAHPGFRISLLHLDLDLAEPTLSALEAFWPRVVRGGVVIFDEYAISSWSESQGVDQFFRDKSITLKTIPWMRTPTAYLIKEAE